MDLQASRRQPLPEGSSFASLRTGSGPLLGRIDIHIDVPRLENDRPGEPSAAIQGRVEREGERQMRRYQGTHLLINAGPSAGSGQA